MVEAEDGFVIMEKSKTDFSQQLSPNRKEARSSRISVIPKPQLIELGEGKTTLPACIFVSGPDSISKIALDSLMKRRFDARRSPDGESAEVQFLRPDAGSRKEIEKMADPLETYQLSIFEGGVIIAADSQRGWFYGLQTLLQLIDTVPRKDGCPVLPRGVITDWPRFEWRGFMLDESRHFSGIEVVKRILDTMAYYKLNVFHWHLTDSSGWRIEIKGKPKLTTIGAKGNFSDPEAAPMFYSQKQIHEIVSYAKVRQIDVIPEIDMPGHMSAAMRAYPEFSGGGPETDPFYTINPASKLADDFLNSILIEIKGLFKDAEVIHFGGDEVLHDGWKNLEEVKSLISGGSFKSENEIEAFFNRRLAKVINDLGYTVGGWDDVSYSGLGTKGTLLFWWRHDKPELLTEMLDTGYNVVLCPRRPLYFDFLQHKTHHAGRIWKGKNSGGFVPLEDVYRFPDSLDEYAKRPKSGNVKGISANLWTRLAITQERRDFLTFPRLLATAESAWTLEQNKNWGDFFKSRLFNHIPILEDRGFTIFNPYTITPDITE